jgi:DNA-binding NtrC family response regulator
VSNTLYPSEPILIVDDESEIRSSLRNILALEGITNVVESGDGDDARAQIRERSFAAAVLDLMMPKVAGLELLHQILAELPGTPVIVATGTGDEDTAVRCMRAGAFDYLTKPIDLTRLVTSVRHALEKWETAREMTSLRAGVLAIQPAHPEAFAQIVTRDPSMLAIFRYAEAIAQTSLPVLVTGETGVGKELMARSIHSVSGRAGSFVPVNVAGLDDALFADTLFGHLKGAYTGADRAREGMVAKAEEGTLFLDEIGDLAPESQIKLLRLLQEREYYPLGADQPRPTSARFVVATNVDLGKVTEASRFRKDLLFRLKSHQIRLPSLRERRSDLSLLIDHFFDKASDAVGKTRPTVPRQLTALLAGYPFPGNIRELEGMIYDAVVRHDSRMLSLDSFRAIVGGHEGEGPDGQREGTPDARQNIFADFDSLPTLKNVERQLIEEALGRADDNQSIAAQHLGLTRQALNKRLNRNS